MKLPDDFSYSPFYKSLGDEGAGELIGAGFMRKPLAKVDHVNFNPAFHSLCLVLGGKGEYHDHRGNKWQLREGMYFQRIPGYQHSTYISESGSWVECFIDIGTNLCQAMLATGMINPLKPCGIVHNYVQRMEDVAELRRYVQRYDGVKLQGMIPQALHIHHLIINGEAPSDSSEDDSFLSRATRLLEDDISHNIDLQKICRENGWGYEWFRKEFRRRAGISPHKFRLRRRIDMARNLLNARRELSLEDISRMLGYCSVYEFSAQFRKYAGVSPGKFRNG